MIEVFPEKDYNVLACACDALGIVIKPGSGGMVMREDGEVTGAVVWMCDGVTADIYAVKAPDRYGAYYDLSLRSALNHLLTRAEKIIIRDSNDFYIPLGFTDCGGFMTADITGIKFPHKCR